MDNEQRIAELEARIEKLEADEPDGMSRRDAMKLGGAGLAGALMGGGGSMAAVDRASAGTYQAGSLGTAEDPLDLTVDDISVVDSGGTEQGSVDESGIDVPAVTTDHLLTASRAADVVIHDLGSQYVADGPDGIIDQDVDAGVVHNSIIANVPNDGWHVRTAAGTYDFDTTVEVDQPRMVYTFPGMAATLRATSAIGQFFKIERSGSYMEHGPRFFGGFFDGNGGNATRALTFDSVRNVIIWDCYYSNLGTEFLLVDGDVSSTNSDHWLIERVKGVGKFGTLRAGSSGNPADIVINNVVAATMGADVWGLEIIDCARIHVEKFHASDNSNQAIKGAVKVTAPGASGAPDPTGFHELNYVSVENGNVSGGSDAVAVEIDGDSDTIQGCLVKRPRAYPTIEAKAVHLKNSSGSIRRNRGTTIEGMRTTSSTAGYVTIDSDVYQASVQHEHGSRVDEYLSDSGDFTTVNGLGQEASGGQPTADKWNPGDLVEDTNNSGDLYLLLRDGSTWTQLAT
jgi:hypothetical protein